MLGDFYFANGDLDKATAEYASLYSDHPRDMQVKRNYIQLLILKNQLQEATKLNDELVKDQSARRRCADLSRPDMLRQNDASGAVDALQQASRMIPATPWLIITWTCLRHAAQ